LEKELEPLAMFLYSIKSDETKNKYRNKLYAFFDFVGLKGSLDKKAEQFVEKGRADTAWAFSQVMKFVAFQRERAEKNEIVNGTVLNYYKPIKLFCEVNEIDLKWKKISRGLPRGRRFSLDRIPTIEEIRALLEYPDRRIKPIKKH
jgi:integrase